MKQTILILTLLLLGPLAVLHAAAPAGTPAASPKPDAPAPAVSTLALVYRQPAKNWEEALPVGNGHMGAMIFGTLPTERIQFNEHTVWTGQPHSYAHEGAVKALPEMRRLLQEMRKLERDAFALDPKGESREAKDKLRQARDRQKRAEGVGTREFMSQPLGQKAYQPCGDLWIDFASHHQSDGFRRWLDLDTATAVTEYKSGGVTYRREVLASFPDRAVCVRLTADKPGKLDCVVRLDSPHKDSQVTLEGGRTLVLRGRVEAEGIPYGQTTRTGQSTRICRTWEGLPAGLSAGSLSHDELETMTRFYHRFG